MGLPLVTREAFHLITTNISLLILDLLKTVTSSPISPIHMSLQLNAGIYWL